MVGYFCDSFSRERKPERIGRKFKAENPIPSRQLAESSPYFEALREKEVEILFCYEPYDELVLMQLQQFDKKKMTSVEKEMQQTPEEVIKKNI